MRVCDVMVFMQQGPPHGPTSNRRKRWKPRRMVPVHAQCNNTSNCHSWRRLLLCIPVIVIGWNDAIIAVSEFELRPFLGRTQNLQQIFLLSLYAHHAVIVLMQPFPTLLSARSRPSLVPCSLFGPMFLSLWPGKFFRYHWGFFTGL